MGPFLFILFLKMFLKGNEAENVIFRVLGAYGKMKGWTQLHRWKAHEIPFFSFNI